MTTYMYIDFMFHVATAQLWAGLQRMSCDDCYSVCRDFDASIMHNVPVSFSMYRICALFKATFTVHWKDNVSLCTCIPSWTSYLTNRIWRGLQIPASFGDTSMGFEYATGFWCPNRMPSTIHVCIVTSAGLHACAHVQSYTYCVQKGTVHVYTHTLLTETASWVLLTVIWMPKIFTLSHTASFMYRCEVGRDTSYK